MKNKILCLSLIMIFAALILNAADSIDKLGQSTMTYLKINPLAKFSAMGGAGFVDAFGIEGTYMNPAGVAWLSEKDENKVAFNFSNKMWLGDTDIYFFSGIYEVENVGVFGLSMSALSFTDTRRTSEDDIDGENDIYDASGENLLSEFIDIGDFSIGLIYSRMITETLSMGGKVKFVNSTLDKYDGKGVAFDIGTIYYTGFRTLRLGIGMFNYGSKIEFQQDSYHLPLMFKIGVGYDFELAEKNILKVLVDYVDPNDYAYYLNSGMEYSYANMFFARAGYKYNHDL